MSNVSGSISVNVEFRDTTMSSGVQSLKTIALRDSAEYTGGNVAIITGTVGTTRVTINPASITYRDAAGDNVAFTSVRRIAFTASPAAGLIRSGIASTISAYSVGDACVVSEFLPTIVPGGYGLITTAGTASYTLVLYGT